MKKQSIDPEALYGASGAANILECHFRTVITHAIKGTLPHVVDSSGKRLFKYSTLKAAKDAGLIQYHRPRCNHRRAVANV